MNTKYLLLMLALLFTLSVSAQPPAGDNSEEEESQDEEQNSDILSAPQPMSPISFPHQMALALQNLPFWLGYQPAQPFFPPAPQAMPSTRSASRMPPMIQGNYFPFGLGSQLVQPFFPPAPQAMPSTRSASQMPPMMQDNSNPIEFASQQAPPFIQSVSQQHAAATLSSTPEKQPSPCRTASKQKKTENRFKPYGRKSTVNCRYVTGQKKAEVEDYIGSDGKTVYPCRYCHRLFKTNKDRRRHEERADGSAPGLCDVCDRKFTHISGLDYHRGKCPKAQDLTSREEQEDYEEHEEEEKKEDPDWDPDQED